MNAIRIARLPAIACAVLLFGYAPVLLGQQPNAPQSPHPREESRYDYTLPPNSNCGVEVGGQILLGQTTVGGGQLTFRNIGSKDVAAIRMTMNYQTDSGSISLPGDMNEISLEKRGEAWLRQGHTARLVPFASNITNPGDAIHSVLPGVTGVIYSDGTTCGEDGQSLKAHYMYSLETDKQNVNMALNAYSKLGPTEFRNMIISGSISGVPWGQELVPALRHWLLDSNGNLVQHPDWRMQQWIQNLAHPFESQSGGAPY